jgi:glycosyltransferase involved in cell wall biosynthesis
VHGWPFLYGPKHERVVSFVSEWLAGRLLGATVVCVSDADATLARKYRIVAPQHLRVVPNALAPRPTASTESTNEATATRIGPPHVVMVARHFPQKDHATATEALGSLRDTEWTATFAGDGPLLDANRKRIETCGLAHRIACPGDVIDVDALLLSADIFLLCTHSEGLPISVLEAVRSGLPIVATDLPQVREAVPIDWPAEFVPPDRPDLIAMALTRMFARLAADTPLRNTPAESQRDQQNRLQWDAAIARLSALLADAATPRRTLRRFLRGRDPAQHGK